VNAPAVNLKWLRLVLAAVALLPASAALASSLTIDDPLISAAECVDASAKELTLTWDLGSSSGATIDLLGSDTSGCPSSDATTALLVEGLDASRTGYPAAGEGAITLADLLAAAGDSANCSGADRRAYLCARLLDSNGSTVTTVSAMVNLQFSRPPPPVALSVTTGDGSLYVAWTAGTATTAAPATAASYRAFAAAGGASWSSAETAATSARIPGLSNGTTYDVWVVAYSAAGNASEPSALSAGTPWPVKSFIELYQEAGGVETPGCGSGGGGDLALPLAGVALWRMRRRRRGERTGPSRRRATRRMRTSVS